MGCAVCWVGSFQPDQFVTRAQLAYLLWKYDHVVRPFTIDDESAILDIVHGDSWEWKQLKMGDPLPQTFYESNDGYRWPDVQMMVGSLCRTMDKAREGTVDEYSQAVGNWLLAQDWEPGTSHIDRWRIVLSVYGVCYGYSAALDLWGEDGYVGVEKMIDGTDTHPNIYRKVVR